MAGKRAFSRSSPRASRMAFQLVLMNFLVNWATKNLRVHVFSHSLFMHLGVRSFVRYVSQQLLHAVNWQ